MPRIGKPIETESRLDAARGWRQGQWEVTANGCEASFSRNENVLELVVIFAQPEL